MFFIAILVLNANVDPDQTPRSAASDLGLQCLQMSLLWDTRHKWVLILSTVPRRLLCSSFFFKDSVTLLFFLGITKSILLFHSTLAVAVRRM